MSWTTTLDRLIQYNHVDEYPSECVQWLINTVKDHGLAGLKENKLEAISCILTIVAWAMGKLKKERPDDGVLIGEAGPVSDLTILCAHLEGCQDADVNPVMGIAGNGWVLRQIINLLIPYLLAILSDSDRVQSLLEEVLAWLERQLSG